MWLTTKLRSFWRQAKDSDYRAHRSERRAFHSEHGKGTPDDYKGLKPGDVVIDVGSYKGNWAIEMADTYGVTVHCFEPHPVFARQIEDRFAERDDIIAHGYALGRGDGVLSLSDDQRTSSPLAVSGSMVSGEVRAVVDVFDELGLDRVAVMKVNSEGGEYELLPALLDGGLMDRIDRLTVQFHQHSEDEVNHREEIRAGLAVTHDCVWEYPFVWEEWARRVG